MTHLCHFRTLWHTRAIPAAPRERGARFPGETISHAAWLYDCCRLNHRDVEELRYVGGVIVSREGEICLENAFECCGRTIHAGAAVPRVSWQSSSLPVSFWG